MRRGLTGVLLDVLRSASAQGPAAAPAWGVAASANGLPSVPLVSLSAMYSHMAAGAASCAVNATPAPLQDAANQLLRPQASAAAAPSTQQHYGFATSAQQQGSAQQSQRRPPMAPRPATAPPMQTGIVHVQATRNNTIFTLTDDAGNTKAWCDARMAACPVNPVLCPFLVGSSVPCTPSWKGCSEACRRQVVSRRNGL